MEPIETINYKGCNIEIHYDTDPMNPREEMDSLGKMVCWHNHHQLGDEQPKMDSEAFIQRLVEKADPELEDKIYYWENGDGWKILNKQYPFYSSNATEAITIANERVKNLIQKSLLKHFIILPLYLYDHSGITISTGPFSCPWDWDSGQVGYIYVEINKIKKEYNWNLLTKNRKQMIIDILETEVKIYNDYLTGNIYGFIVNNSKEEEIHSCWGFNGTDWRENGLLEMAESEIDYYITTRDRIQNELKWLMNNCWAD